ncbi:MAG: PilZ domain-containing protein [Deltaproteobacteria bacterium]|nr:PilZ domain-containing protein [Deltaproteobacteria bacterium]
MSTDKQRAPRFKVTNLRVIYDTGEEFWSGPVVDMSESGIFVETMHQLPAGTKVTILPDLPDEEQLPFEIQGEVVRTSEYAPDVQWDRIPGIAFRLTGLTVRQFEQLRGFLGRHGVPMRSGSQGAR